MLPAPAHFSAWDALILAALLVAGAACLAGQREQRRRGVVVRRRELAAFWAGWTTLVMAVSPPVDALVVWLFSVHMAQHELMMLVGAPLCAAGRPLPRLLSGLPGGARRHAIRLLQSAPAKRTWAVLTMPALAWGLHALVLWVWHVPALYQLAVAHEGVHALQHAMFVGTAALFWWGVIYGRYGRAGYGAATLFVFMTAMHSGILGAAFTFAGVPLYPDYVAAAHQHGIDALADQQRAGLLMWVPAGFILTLTGLGLFAAWLGEAERRERLGSTASAKFEVRRSK